MVYEELRRTRSHIGERKYLIGGTPYPKSEVRAYIESQWKGKSEKELIAKIAELTFDLQDCEENAEDLWDADFARDHVDNCRKDDCTDDSHNFR